MQISDSTHRQSWQIRHLSIHLLSYSDNQRTDSFRLVYYDQQLAVFGDKICQEFLNLRLGLWQRFVMHYPALLIDCGGVMLRLSDVDTNEYLGFHIDHLLGCVPIKTR